MFFRKKIKPNVSVQIYDETFIRPASNVLLSAVIGSLNGPTKTIINLSVDKPKWYQFWKFKQYKIDCKKSRKKFIESFGEPTTPNLSMDAYNAYKATFDQDKLFTIRVKE